MRQVLPVVPAKQIHIIYRPRYISAERISTLFWCTEWTWNWLIIFRFASIHGRACSNRWKEHPYIVLQWPKYDFNADLYLLQPKLSRDKQNINMTMI
jgi:hypothetical protein